MLVETTLREVPPPEIPRMARLAEELGYDGLTCSEVRQEPFVVATAAATATERVQLATSVAIAFPRSPMVVAYTARTLQDLSGGRFALGLGTQVRGHVERRFSSTWDSPGPRLREYVQALRAIWDCWQTGTPLDFRGRFYTFTLMTPEFNPGPGPHALRIHLAAVNPYNVETVATFCDGLRVHSFCTPEYLRDVLWPQVRAAAARANRPLETFEMIGGTFLTSGPTEEAVRAAREQTRRRVAFYASTRAYARVLDHHGWSDLGPALRALIAESRWSDLATLIPDEVLDHFAISAPYPEIADRVQERLGGLVDRVNLPMPEDAAAHRDDLAQAIAALKAIPPASSSACR